MVTLYSKNSRFSVSTGISCLLFLGASVCSQAQTTLDFENYSNPDSPSGFNDLGPSAGQSGFTLVDSQSSGSPGGLHSVAPNGASTPTGYNYTGSVAIFNGGPGNQTVLTQDNALPFSVGSIDIANLQTQAIRPGGVTVTFTGQEVGGGVATASFTHAADDSLTTVTFDSSFSDLTSFSIDQTYPYNQFDNIVVSSPVAGSTPEPGSVALLTGIGIAGASFLKRRNRRK